MGQKLLLIQNANQFVRFVWTPSHVDNPGNGYVDNLAKEASKQQTTDLDLDSLYQTNSWHDPGTRFRNVFTTA